MTPPALLLAWRLYKLPEPERGGKGALAEGQREIGQSDAPEPQQRGEERERLIARKAREAGVEPREHLVCADDPGGQSLWWAIRYVLSVPTNRVLIISSASAMPSLRASGHFGLSMLGAAGLCGVWVGGYLGDHLLAKGHPPARVWVATGFFA